MSQRRFTLSEAGHKTWETIAEWVEREKKLYRERYGDEPFARMREDTEELQLPGKHADTIKAELYRWIATAERSYKAGRVDEALLTLFEALTNVYIRTYLAAPKIQANKPRDRGNRTTRAKVEAAFGRAFQSDSKFRWLQPAKQRDYLLRHDEPCKGIDPETMGKYVRACAAQTKKRSGQ